MIVIIYFSLLMFSIFTDIFPFYKFWFSFALIFLSLMLFPRYIIFNIDTNLWAGCSLLLAGVAGIIAFEYKFSVILNVSSYLICFATASLIMFLFFRQIFHFKIFTSLSLFAIILYVYSINLIKLWFAVSLLSVLGLLVVAICLKTIIVNMRKV